MHLAIRLLGSCALLMGLPTAAWACDNLRMNQAAYQRCVMNQYGPNASSGRPAYLTYEYWDRRAREQAEQEATQQRARPAPPPPPPPPARESTPAERVAFLAMLAESADTQRGFRKRNLQREHDLEEVERRVHRELQAARQAAEADGRYTADEYTALLGVVFPHGPLMIEWADRAAAAFGGRFAVMAALARTVGCPTRKPALIRLVGNWDCPPGSINAGYQQLAALAPSLQPADLLLACLPVGSRAQNTAAAARRMNHSSKEAEAEFMRLVAEAQAPWNVCKPLLASLPPAVQQGFKTLMDETVEDVWTLALHPVLRTEADWADPQRLKTITEHARARSFLARLGGEERNLRIRRYEREGVDLGWGTPLEPTDFDDSRIRLTAEEQRWAPLRQEQVRLHEQGRWAEAVAAGEHVLRYGESGFPTDNKERMRAQVLNLLAQSHWKLGQLDKAESRLHAALNHWLAEARYLHDWARGTPDKDYLPLLAPRTALAHFYEATGRCAEATPFRQAVLRMSNEQFGPLRPQMARALEGLAGNQACLGQHSQAAVSYQKALAIWAARGDEARQQVADTLSRLAQVRAQAGQASDAAAHQRLALEVRKQLTADGAPPAPPR